MRHVKGKNDEFTPAFCGYFTMLERGCTISKFSSGPLPIYLPISSTYPEAISPLWGHQGPYQSPKTTTNAPATTHFWLVHFLHRQPCLVLRVFVVVIKAAYFGFQPPEIHRHNPVFDSSSFYAARRRHVRYQTPLNGVFILFHTAPRRLQRRRQPGISFKVATRRLLKASTALLMPTSGITGSGASLSSVS